MTVPEAAGETTECRLAARVLGSLLLEDYGGVRRHITGGTLRLPGGPAVPLRRGGFLAEATVAPDAALRLDDVLAAASRLADPRDDMAAFTEECRQALATARLHDREHAAVLARLARVDPRGSGTYYEALAAFTDHPVYPTARCRTGLTEADLRRHAPEFHPTFALHWAAVPRHRVVASGERPAWWPDPADVGLPSRPDTDLLPLHPLTPLPCRDLAVVRAPDPYLEVTPTLSMRTVAVDAGTHLKLPLPTSTLGLRNRRTIVPGTLADGALMQRILRAVGEREPDAPVLLADEQTYGHAGDPLLGYLVRRLPEQTRGAHVVPVAALLAKAPGGGHVIERWPVPELFDGYLRALFGWNVTLFARYGIALEAHQQNVSLVIGDDARRPSLLLKDNDGALVDPGTLAAALGAGPYDFADARMTTSDPEALARVFVTITLHLCAGAVAFGLAERGLLPLGTGLAMLRERLGEALDRHDPAGPAGLLRSRTLHADRLPTKAMVTAGTLVDKARTGARDVNKHYGPPAPNYLRGDTCS
ncbi:IucA/IucC family protein [Actinomadura alba]|uniref:IucA/IucC family protein n=1 Tax=Actinomadura alba TaxID=406431 RepID=A0ABR7LXC8_9ACTN|nr:IucA/IucC family protein [Actinomadura alba]MBC6469425.1 IucA/IucC family protein [Actinomadura alba]